ncbi:glycosyltransferase family 2 protein [Polynucleobacter paneuropaeus]|nr:glycosyltransferase family 2 protein [Polynucleobacter paneuropaeus]
MNNYEIVSIVVSTHNSANYLEGCLQSIRSQTYPNIELIIVDDSSRDGTCEIAKKYADRVYEGINFERSVKRNYGAKNAAGEFVLICDSDMILESNVIASAVQLMRQDNQILQIVIPEKSIGFGFWSKCKALERSFYVGVDWMEASRFFRRNVFLEIGGYDEINTGSEDYDLPQRIEGRYGAACKGRVDYFITQNELEISLLSQIKKKYYYSASFIDYKKNVLNSEKFSKQSSLIERYKIFFSNHKKLFSDPFIGSGLIFMKTIEFLAGGLGYYIAVFKNLKK